MINEITFPKGFEDRLKAVTGDETYYLIDALKDRERIPVSVRFNPFKADKPSAGTPVPWCKYGRYLTERPQFTLDPEFHAGNYYVQEASSMFVGYLFEKISENTEIKRVLDMCAAPGGKTTLYSAAAGLETTIVANEPVRQRAMVLADNIRKWGLGNVVVTSNDPQHFAKLDEWFDVVAVDAPCSGEGMFRKSDEARFQWSPDNVRMCAARQKRIIADAWKSLRPGGVLIYSTCTFNKEENEDNVAWMLEEFDCEAVNIEVPGEWNIVETKVGDVSCFRFYPHLVLGEGFFACAIQKGGHKGKSHTPKARRPIFCEVSKSVATDLGRWVGQPDFMRFTNIADNLYGYYEESYRDIKTVSENLTAIHSGVCMGQIFGKTLKPDHSLALFHDVSRGVIPTANLTLNDAIRYLRREDSAGIEKMDEGINLVCYQEDTKSSPYPLGWAKRIGVRANNLYPKSMAIQNKKL